MSPQWSMFWGHALTASAVCGITVLGAGTPAHAGAAADTSSVEFNADFLQSNGAKKADISRFSKTNAVSAGDYLVDLKLNGEWRERVTLRFEVPLGAVNAKPCLTLPVLARVGLNLAALPMGTRSEWGPDTCIDPERIGRDAKVSFDMSTLTLSLSLPQAILLRRPHGYVSPRSWDKGVPSVTLAYDASVFRTTDEGVTTTSVFAGLTAGANLGDWHFRDRSSLSGAIGRWTFQNIAAYVQRDLPGIQSNLMLGDTYTDGAVFDSFGFRGVALGTDDRMRPDSLAGYAPIVRGIAHTNARVRITQHGTLLMETTVAPGAFEIDDLYPTGYGGDLLVTVLESDGSQESFTVTYASLVQLLRPHVWRYAIALGDLQVNGIRTGDAFFQATLQHGMTDAITTYAGAQSAPGYGAGLIGAALNTPLGGLALDATLARTRVSPMQVDRGYSARLSYSKIVPGIHTNIALAAYRYSSSGFWSLQDAVANRSAILLNKGTATIQRQHSRYQINVTQNLPKHWGNLYLTGSTTKYWNNGGLAQIQGVTQYQAGYSNVAAWHKMIINYGVAVSQQRDDVTDRADRRVLFNMSMALGQKANAPRLAVNLGNDQAGGQSQTSGDLALNGTLGQNGEFSYGANLNVAPGANAVALNSAYRAPFATVSGSASKGKGFTQGSLSISGAVVVHPGGVTMASTLGDTVAIADAPGARGAVVATGTGTRIDGAGYAIVPYLVPYRENQVSIDPHGTSLDVEMQITSQQVAPHANAVVMLHYPTTVGSGVIFVARLPDGTAVPFGADVVAPHQPGAGPDAGIVGQNGQIFMRGLAATGRLQVKWGDRPDASCTIDYAIPKHPAATAPSKIESRCLPDQPAIAAVTQNLALPYLPLDEPADVTASIGT